MANTKSKRKYVVVDRDGKPVARAFDSERKAYEAMGVYRDNCADIALPMSVVPEGLTDDVVNEASYISQQ